MENAARLRWLQQKGLVHPDPSLVTAPLFTGAIPFFFPADKVQVKYEMLRAHLVDGRTVTEAARVHGYARASFYLALAAFGERGMTGLLDERRGRRGPLKMTTEIVAYIREAAPSLSGADLAAEIERTFGVQVHRRTIERARRR